MKEYVVSGKDAGKRVDRFLQERRSDLTRVFILKGIRTRKVKRNGRRTEGSERLEAGDRIEDYMLPREARAPERVRTDGFSVAYEDSHVLVVFKRAGLLCEDATGRAADTLLAEVNQRQKDRGEGEAALAHRIDYNTSGLVILAKDGDSLAVLEKSIRARSITKRYLCVVLGEVRPASGTLRNQLFKDAKKNRVYLSDEPVKGARTAVTKYRRLAVRGGLSLVECELVTGRTHQIRSQMAYAGWPLLGDEKYGSKERNKPYGERRQLLCAYQLTFRFPQPGPLSYLEGKTVALESVWFREKYFGK